MATKIFVHGSGHKATSWEKTISYMTNNEDIVCPNLSSILEGKEASYENLYSSFVKYCNEFDGQIHLCGLSLGGILALNFALDFPQKVKTLVLIGTPYKVPKVAFSFQNIIFRFLPKSIFETMALVTAIYYLGKFLRTKVNFLSKYCIPAPVVGGLVFAIITLILKLTNLATITLDTTLQNLFMTMFL